jgi:signal transduction histidine kinase
VGGRPVAVFLVALRDDAPSERAALFWEVLESYGDQLGTLLDLDAEHRAAARRQQEFAEQTELADLAALASPVTHEFNNFLNTLILQLMVLANQVPEQFRSDLCTIGQQAKGVASLVRQWQQHRAQHRAAPRHLDVNLLIAEVVEQVVENTAESATPLVLVHDDAAAVSPKAVALRVALADDLSPVEGAPLDLRLLVRLLINNAAATITARPGSLLVSTARHDGTVLMSVEDNGPSLPESLLPRMFELSVETREGANQLELAACEALVQRRLRGRIHAENRPAGGLAIRVQLRPV